MPKPDVTVRKPGTRSSGPSVRDTGSASGNRKAIRGYISRHGGTRKFSTRVSRPSKRK